MEDLKYERVNWKDYPDVSTRLNAENLNKMDKGIEEATNAINEMHDSKDITTTFTSADTVKTTAITAWTDVAALTSGEQHSSIFGKVSKMFKNVRYLYKLLGTTDISAIGDGSVTGALSSLNSNYSQMFTVIKCCLYSGDGIMPFTYGLFTLSVEIPDGYKLLSVIAMSGDKSGTFTYTVIDISDAAFTVALINENDTINYPGTITFKCLVGKC